ncbi:hypothetical protein ACIOGZ_29575 [Kitasatospora sp. NPDC088160]|uniref:hypothetical protein n=1 Tax=Kitasatospora sp. NPDC088160 TaxID=3364072 RepID=UPI003809083B
MTARNSGPVSNGWHPALASPSVRPPGRVGSRPGDVAALTADGQTPPSGQDPAVIEYGDVVRIPRPDTRVDP